MERRQYSRLTTKIDGTLYKDNTEIPVTIENLSENGIGLRYRYRDCPSDFQISKGDIFTLSFIDNECSFFIIQNIHICQFKVVQIQKHSSYVYIGGELNFSENDYAKYVLDKKSERFIASLKFVKASLS